MTEAVMQELERIKTLSVVGLRQELDKHGLEKSGLKADLIKRLEKCIMDGSASPKECDTTTQETINVNDDAQKPTGGSVSSTPEVNVSESSANPELSITDDDSMSTLTEDFSDEIAKSTVNVVETETQSLDIAVPDKNVSSAEESSENVIPESDAVRTDVILKDATEDKNESADCTVVPNAISLEEETEPISDDEIPGIETETDPISDEDLPVSETETDPISDEELPDDDMEKDGGAQEETQPTDDGATNDNERQCEFVDVPDRTEESVETEVTTKNPEEESNTQKDNGNTDNATQSSDDEVEIIVPPPKPKAPLVVIEDDDTNDEISNEKDQNTDKNTDPSTNKSKSSVKREKENKKSSDPKKKSDRKTSSTTSKTSRTQKSSSKDKKVENKRKEIREEKKNDLSRSLWISKLSSITRAVDLKELFAEHGKVVGAKVVTSAKLPGSQCFGYVTMSTVEEAAACIAKFDKTVLHEQTIDVEKAKTDPTPGAKKPSSKAGERMIDEKSRHRSSSKISSSSRSRHDDKNRSHERKSDEEKKKKDKTVPVKSTAKNDKPSKDAASTSKEKSSKDPSKEKASKDTPKEKSTKDSSKEKSSKDQTKSSKEKSSKAGDSGSTTKDDAKGVVVVIDDQKKDTQSKKDSAKKTDKSDTTSKEKAIAEKEAEAKEKEAREKARRERIEAERKAREERRRKEKEEEEKEREERRKYLEKREKERREWERKESERLRAERERQREEERVREHERSLREKMAKERYLREKREREERAREEERERLEQERIEREAFVRAHQDRLRRDKEREERELAERERQRKERMEQEELQFRMEKERIQDEISRLEQKCAETERQAVMVDRGLGLKRPSGDDRMDSHPDAKRMLNDSTRKEYFSPATGRNDSVATQYHKEQTFDRGLGPYRGHDQPNSADSRDSPRNAMNRREDDIVRTNPNQERFPKASDIRRVIPNDGPVRTYNRERSPQRADPGSKYQEPSRSHNNAPKTLSDVLGRAGLSGILGTRAEEKPTCNSSSTRTGDRYYAGTQNVQDGASRVIDRSQDNAASDFRKPHPDSRVDSNETRDIRSNDSHQRNERRPDERRIDRRPDERRNDESRIDGRRNEEPRNARHESANVSDGYSRGDREKEYKANTVDIRDDRRDSRNDNDRASQNQPPVNNTNIPNDRNFNTNASHPSLPRDIGGILPLAGQPRVLPFTDIFGRPLQILPNAQAINAGYAAAAVQAQVQNIALQNMGRSPAAGIQLNRNGQLELARMNTTPQANVGVQGGRRF